jgi:hypothetical protein
LDAIPNVSLCVKADKIKAKEEKAIAKERRKKAEIARLKRQERQKQNPKHEPKFTGVGRSLNGTTTGTEESTIEESAREEPSDFPSALKSFLLEGDEFEIQLENYYGRPGMDEVRETSDDPLKSEAVADKLLAKFDEEGDGGEEVVSDLQSVLAKTNNRIKPHLRDDGIEAIVSNKGGAIGRDMKRRKVEALALLTKEELVNAMVNSVTSGRCEFNDMSIAAFMEKHGGGGRRLGSIDDNEEENSGVVTVRFLKQREVFTYDFLPTEKESVRDRINMFYELGDIVPGSMFALTFGNVEGYKIANGKDLLNPYVLADKYTFLFWSIAMYTDKVPSEERRFSDILKELVPDKDFEFVEDSRPRIRELSEKAKMNLAQEESEKEAKARKQEKKIAREARKNG